MALNISRGNMYTFVTHTWNTVKGKCPHDCSYCYMQRFGERPPARFDRSELRTNLGNGNFIFVGSGNDMFAADIPGEWINETLNHCAGFNNKYLFQTKNPARFLDFIQSPLILQKAQLCTTIETNRWYPEIMKHSPTPHERVAAMELASKSVQTLVTIEPILDFDLDELVGLIRQCNPIQVNIGADSGNNKLPEPDKQKVTALIHELKQFTVIDQKRNLGRIIR